MDPLTAMAIASALPKLYQLGQGIGQSIKGSRLGKTRTPMYQVPAAADDALALARYRALETRLPGQSLMEDKIGAASAGTISALKETAPTTSALLAGVSAAKQGEQEQYANLAIEAAKMHRQNQSGLENALNHYAAYQEKQWDINQYRPFLATMDRARELKSAGRQNIYNSIEGMSGLASVLLGNYAGKQKTDGSSGNMFPEGGLENKPYNPDLPYGMQAGGAYGKYMPGTTWRTDPQEMELQQLEEKELAGALNPAEDERLRQLRGY